MDRTFGQGQDLGRTGTYSYDTFILHHLDIFHKFIVVMSLCENYLICIFMNIN